MKRYIVSLSIIVLICLSNFHFVLSVHILFQGSTPLKYLTKFASDQPTLQHQVVKRQTSAPTPEDSAIYEAKLKDASCTSGIEQGSVETALSCNLSTIEEAQKAANACTKGEGEQFCGSLWERYRLRSNYIRGNCSRVL